MHKVKTRLVLIN